MVKGCFHAQSGDAGTMAHTGPSHPDGLWECWACLSTGPLCRCVCLTHSHAMQLHASLLFGMPVFNRSSSKVLCCVESDSDIGMQYMFDVHSSCMSLLVTAGRLRHHCSCESCPAEETLDHEGRLVHNGFCCNAQGLYCVGDSTFPGQGVNAVVFSGFGCAHRVLCDQGKQAVIPVLDQGYNSLLAAVRDRS